MRLFIEIDLPKEIRTNISSISDRTRSIKGIKIPQENNIHLTLLFLGETKKPQEVAEMLSGINFKKFSLKTKEIGFFPNGKDPRVAWLGLEHSPQLIHLQKQIASLFKNEEKYIPHITVARIKEISQEDKKKIIEAIYVLAQKEMIFEVNNFKLMSSELTSMGPVHRTIHSFPATD